MDYCFAHGFTAGKNFSYNSGYPIDANWPWLISVGNDVTLSSNVRILAHDASTAKVGAHTKIGIVGMNGKMPRRKSGGKCAESWNSQRDMYKAIQRTGWIHDFNYRSNL